MARMHLYFPDDAFLRERLDAIAQEQGLIAPNNGNPSAAQAVLMLVERYEKEKQMKLEELTAEAKAIAAKFPLAGCTVNTVRHCWERSDVRKDAKLGVWLNVSFRDGAENRMIGTTADDASLAGFAEELEVLHEAAV